MNKLPTAPAQSPNIEYDVTGDEPEVFAEDEKKEMPKSACIKVGNLYYSKLFYINFESQYTELFEEVEEIGSIHGDFCESGEIDLQDASYKLWTAEISFKMLKGYFTKLGVKEWRP